MVLLLYMVLLSILLSIAKVTIGFICKKNANHPFLLKERFFSVYFYGISSGPANKYDFR